MMKSDLTFFLLGVLVSIPAGIFANLLYGRSEKYLAHRSAGRAELRAAKLSKEISEIEVFVREPHRFTQLILAKLMVVNAIWIGCGILSSVLCTFISGSNAAYFLINDVPPLDPINNVVYTVDNFLSTIILFAGFQVSRRSYSLWRKVHNFENYKQATLAEINQLHSVSKLQRSAAGDALSSTSSDGKPKVIIGDSAPQIGSIAETVTAAEEGSSQFTGHG